MARGVGNDPGKRGGCCRQLGCYPAGPEYGNFAGMNGNRITEFGFVQIADADFSGVPQMNRFVDVILWLIFLVS